MKKIFLSFYLILSMMSLGADLIEFSYEYQTPQIFNQSGYDRILLPELSALTKPGYPELPVQPVQLLLPAGHEIASIRVSTNRTELMEGSFNIFPGQRPYPLSYTGSIDFTPPDQSVYNQNEFYPNQLHTEISTQYLRGHAIAVTNIFPFQFNPISNELIFYRNMTVSIETRPSSVSQNAFSRFYRDDQKTQNRVRNIIQNDELLQSYPQSNRRDNDDLEYIIITPESFYSDLTEFIQFKESQGYHVFTKTTQSIYNEYPGVDIADQIRNFIIDAYQNMGAENILLVGDTNLLPHRGFWVNAGGEEDYNIPSELYYEGLDRVGTGTGPDWNTNSNTKWAETSEADYLAEVYVGRISAENSTELLAALNKQMFYQDAPVIGNLQTALMVGENLNNNPVTWGGTYKDEIITGGNFNGYSTIGFPANFTVNTMYERDTYWSATTLANSMNNGLNIINHLGHSNTDYNMKFYNSTVTNQNITANGLDHNYFIIYSQGCLPAAINTNCIAEKFTTIENGCAAYVGNTRYGWYMPAGTNSSSQYMDRQFFHALFNGDASAISELNVRSKEVGVAQCNSSAWFRWSYYCLIVLGDPTLDIWTATPTPITASYQAAVPLGTNNIAFQTDAPFARIGLIQNNELIGRVLADENGLAVLETFAPILTPEAITVSIIAHDRERYIGTLLPISDEPYVIYHSFQIDDNAGNANGLADYGEIIELDFTMTNIGNQPANNVSVLISTDDDYLTMINNIAAFGDFAVNETVTISAAFSLSIGDDVPDQHATEFLVEASDNSGNYWTSNFVLVSNAPEFQAQNPIINDANGNNNGILDPGETASFIINTENIGHSGSPEVIAIFMTDNPLISIEEPLQNLGVIGEQSSVNAIFNVTADPSLPIASLIEFTYILTAGNYSYEHIYQYQIGLIVENFETGDFSSFPWEFSGSADWSISDGAFEGSFCAMSGQIGHNQNSTLQIEINTTAPGQISFWRTVSSEANYDYLRFYIDGNMMGEWSGDVTWEQEIYNVSSGIHLLEWKYIKDQAVVGGTDRARIDFIVFPPLEIIFPPILQIVPAIINVEMMADDFVTEILEISNIGGGVLEYNISSTNSPDWLVFDQTSGSLEGGETDEITLLFNSTNMTAGTYYSALLIQDNLDNQNFVPITLVINETGNNNNLIPMVTELLGNYPNPFNPITEIRYGLSSDSHVRLAIYNVKGQKVITLVDENQEAGYHTKIWNGLDEKSRKIGSGIYFYEIFVDDSDYTSVKKMILLK